MIRAIATVLCSVFLSLLVFITVTHCASARVIGILFDDSGSMAPRIQLPTFGAQLLISTLDGRAGKDRLHYLLAGSTGIPERPPVADPRRGRRTALTFPLLPPPQNNMSRPSDSSPETPTPGGISSFSRTSPV